MHTGQTAVRMILFILPAISIGKPALWHFRIFREAFLLGGAHPDNALYGVQHFLYNNFANMNYPRLAAASVLLILVTAGIGLGVLGALRRSLGGRQP